MKKALSIVFTLAIAASAIGASIYIYNYQTSTKNTSAQSQPAYCSKHFGTVLPPEYFYENGQRPAPEDLEKRLQKFKANFELGTIERGNHFWATQKTSRNQNYFYPLNSMLNWADANNRDIKFHSIVWHEPKYIGAPNDGIVDWYENLPVEERRVALKEYVQGVMTRYKGKIEIYDVVNHPIQYGGDPGNYMLTGWSKAEAIDNIFRWANQINPDAILVLNEWNILEDQGMYDQYYSLLRNLKQKGTPIDAVGSMTHLGFGSGTIPSLVGMKNKLDSFQQLGYKVQITELDLGLPDGENFNPDAEFQNFDSWWDYQAWAYDEVYKLFINHPAVDYIISWGYYDGKIWRPGAGLYTANYTEKPAYTTLKKYLTKEGCNKPTPKPQPELTITSYCKLSTRHLKVSWEFQPGGGASDMFISVDTDNKFSTDNGYWRKKLPARTKKTEIPADFIPISPQKADLRLKTGGTYFIKLHDSSVSYTYPIASIAIESCVITTPPVDPEYTLVQVCVDGEPKVKLMWDDTASSFKNYTVSVDTDKQFASSSDGYWARTVIATSADDDNKNIRIPNGFRGVLPKRGALEIEPKKLYYVKIENNSPKKKLPIDTFKLTECS